MNETPLTHNPMKGGGADNRRKALTVTTIIVLAVLAIAGVAYSVYAYQQNHKLSDDIATKNAQIATLQKQATKTPQTTPTPTTTPTPNPEQLTLGDWGVKFEVPKDLKLADVYYYKTHVGEGSDYYGFTTNRTRAQGGYCDNQVTGNLATLTRSTAKSTSSAPINDTAINGYFYYLGSSVGDIQPTPTCLTTDIATSDHALLDALIKTIAAL